ncbi:N-acetylmuramoyl-L-alanine amidase [Roseobacteraceae bacterium S113]
MSRFFLSVLALFWLWPLAAVSQEFGALARAVPEESRLGDTWRGASDLELGLSGGVPWRVYTVTQPDRVVLDFREVDFGTLDLEAFDGSDAVSAVHAGTIRAGWSRMVLELTQPMAVRTAAMETHAVGARLAVRLEPSDRAAFDAAAGAPEDPGWMPEGPLVVPRPLVAPGMLTVVIDPGHGGIDPGAVRQGYKEADLVLSMALELEEVLLREGAFKTVLTRRDDSFVSLERRVAIAAQAGGHLFISIHADAIEEGVAHGAAVFTLSESAADEATQALVERHERGDLLAGVDLARAEDEVAQILMDLSRQDSAQRSQMLAEAIVGGIEVNGLKMHRRPLQSAGFSVLKSADIPSVLVEAGFLSTDEELERLLDPEWRGRMAQSIADGIMAWALADRAVAPLRRQ